MIRKTHAFTITCTTALALVSGAQAQERFGPYAGGTLGLATDSDHTPFVSAFVGIDRQFGTMIAGAELEHSRTDIGTASGNLDRITRLKLRLGVARRQDRVYGIFGAARSGGAFGAHPGYVLGVGYERRIAEPVSLGAELLHHGFDAPAGGMQKVNTFSMRAIYQF
ncbi:outer membrane beta-barrel protein [Pseudooceanicola aestuarii]|uniref:outer membrane beta-barrel protein n=1 Tax=Pseudooceanicola aestuarii TaxID=2697319 RepID=UPI0019546D92|nr:outer membrane beta-barrel protein [Pseudooceanicola aestuarii]